MGKVSFLAAKPHVVSNDKSVIHTSNTQGEGRVVNSGMGSSPHMTTPFISKGVKSVNPGRSQVHPSNMQGPSSIDGAVNRFSGKGAVGFKNGGVRSGNMATSAGSSQSKMRGVKGIGDSSLSQPQ